MNWMQELCQVYDNVENSAIPDMDNLIPLYHVKQKVDIEIVLNENSECVDINLHKKSTNIIIPCTERSSARSGKNARKMPHPLADKVECIFTEEYRNQLEDWAKWSSAHPFIKVIYEYMRKGDVEKDLKKRKWWRDGKEDKNKFATWIVEKSGEPSSKTWEDNNLKRNWIDYIKNKNKSLIGGLCYVTGKKSILARFHPKKTISSASNAKIISANDDKNFTFRGRFTDKKGCQAINISSELHKKHIQL